MNLLDKNIIMITAGGVGQRFGSSIPKQYLNLNGKPVISYVIEACKKSKFADAVLVVSDSKYHEELTEIYEVDVTVSGEKLNQTKRNGFDYIKSNSSCEKLVVVESVRPSIDSDVIDQIFQLLNEYDAIACAKKITDSLGAYEKWVINREDYYTLNPPEGFRFPLLDKYFDSDSIYTESIQQLPDSSNIYLNFNVPYFDKITYPEDFIRIEAIMKWKESQCR